MLNEYIPFEAVIESIQTETADTKTFRIAFDGPSRVKSFDYRPGQFMQVSLLGVGEAPISIASLPGQKGILELTIRAVGKLTRAIHSLREGHKLYLRGPYGNGFPVEKAKGADLYFIAGGIGLPPLRSVIKSVLNRRNDFGSVKILYGAKTKDEFCFKDELKTWNEVLDVEVLLTVDLEDEDWSGHVGVVTTLCDQIDVASSGSMAFVCGPPIMIRFAIERLIRMGFRDTDIFVTLERHMKCGIGKCGHCNIGEKFVCVDGPVFSYRQLKQFPEKERAIS